jgi:DNA-binding CsgD family transcriptional regulator
MKEPARRFPMKADPLTISVMLTPTQLRIIRMLSDGASTKRIAGAIGISPDCVKTQIEYARKHTGCMTTPQLAVLVFRAGLMEAT